MTRASLPLALLPIILTGCGAQPSSTTDIDQLDRELTRANASAPARDPLLTASLADQIMVDPGLAQGSNANAVRPPPRPDPGSVPPVDIAQFSDRVDADALTHAPPPGGACPECRAAQGALTLGALAARQATPGTAGCATTLRYSAAWANRLPADLPLYPDARVVEAAGSSAGGCRLRVVSFASAAVLGKVVDWYYARARGFGYAAGHKAEGTQHVVAGTRGRDAFVIYASPRSGGGTDIDLIVNDGI